MITIDCYHITYKAIIDTISEGSFDGFYPSSVHARKSNGVDAHRLQLCYYLLIDQSAIDHGDDVECLFVGDTSSVNHMCLYAHTLSHGGG